MDNHAQPKPVSFPIPKSGTRDPHWGMPRSFWLAVAIPSAKRPQPPVASYKVPAGSKHARRLIVYESAVKYMAKVIAESQAAERRAFEKLRRE